MYDQASDDCDVFNLDKSNRLRSHVFRVIHSTFALTLD
jgi:hypothetical protein